MRVLYLGFDVEGVGGIATYSRYQIRALRDLGHHVTIVSVDKTEKRIADIGVETHIPFGDRFRAIRSVLAYVMRRRRDFDLTVVNHVFLAGFALALRTLSGAPYTINVYNIDILTRLSPMRERAFAGADLVIADCRYTIDHIPTYHRRVPPTGLLYDPVDVEFFRPIAKDAARASVREHFGVDLAGRFVIVTVASLLLPPNKGHRQTIEALARLRDPRMLYLIVGGGPDRAAIEAHAREHGVADQVKLLGMVPQETLPPLYACADVANLIARGGPGWGEAVPLGLIEASACETAFICGNEDGSVEAIDPARPNGVAIAPLDTDALAATLRRLADEPTGTIAMGKNGRKVVEDLFAYPVFLRTQGSLLNPVLARCKIKAAA
jgi:glycosyltransferase involved in cell wall biosynthesis